MIGVIVDVPFIGGIYTHGLGENNVKDKNAFHNLKVGDISATSINSC